MNNAQPANYVFTAATPAQLVEDVISTSQHYRKYWNDNAVDVLVDAAVDDAISVYELVRAYRAMGMVAKDVAGDYKTLMEASQDLEKQYLTFKKIAQDYADIKETMDNLELAKRKFLSQHGGFIDLKKYKKAWVRKHGRLRSWTDAVSMAGDKGTPAYALASLLDAISRCKDKARRLTRRLQMLGEQARDKSDSPLADICY